VSHSTSGTGITSSQARIYRSRIRDHGSGGSSFLMAHHNTFFEFGGDCVVDDSHRDDSALERGLADLLSQLHGSTDPFNCTYRWLGADCSPASCTSPDQG
jgi:hypothetical protein